MINKEALDKIHRNVPPDYYQSGIKHNYLQRYWHHRRFAVISRELKKLNLSAPLLDLGCHGGDLTNVLSQAAQVDIYGIDISEKSIEFAKRRFPNINFSVQDFPGQKQFTDNYFQAITAFDVMEHIPDTPKVLDEIKRLLKPGGYFIMAIPNENLLFKVVWLFWTSFKGQVWEGVHVHDFKMEGFAEFEKQGFEKIVELKIIFGMWWFLIFRVKK
ncbi:MAG: methyltransferase domain-containing protein [Patescibacteria group bacterium]|nr:methyltransferase domain-containing protein [Patescibacteria group bacterium]